MGQEKVFGDSPKGIEDLLHEYKKHRFKKARLHFFKKGLVHEFFFVCLNAKWFEKKCLVKF